MSKSVGSDVAISSSLNKGMKPSDRRAFTLIELLVVILMIALMSAIVIPAYSNFYKQSEFKSQMREVQDLFAYAREQAVSRDTTAIVTYDPQSAMFSAIVTLPPPVADQPTEFIKSNNSDVQATGDLAPRTVQLDPRFAAHFSTGNTDGSGSGQNGATTFHFHSDGTVEGGKVALADLEAGDGIVLRLWPSTGRMTLEEDTATK